VSKPLNDWSIDEAIGIFLGSVGILSEELTAGSWVEEIFLTQALLATDLGDNGLDEGALFQSLFHLPTQLEDIADAVLAVRNFFFLINN
jgi:hypothetical protein